MDPKMESGWLIILWIDDNSNKQMGVWKQLWMGSYEWAVMNGQLWTDIYEREGWYFYSEQMVV